MSEPPGLPSTSLWGRLPAPHRRWIVVNALVVAVVFDAVFNAALALLGVGLSDQVTVPVWGVPLSGELSLFGSALGALFLLPLIACPFVTNAIRREVRHGSLEPLVELRAAHRWLAALPASNLRRGIAFGALVLTALAPPMALALLLADPAELTKAQYVIWQTAFAAGLGALVTPVIALCAMTDPP